MPEEQPHLPLDHWRRRTKEYIGGLLHRLDEVSVSDFPATTPSDVISFLQAFFHVLDSEVDKAASEEKLRVFSQLSHQISGNFLPWLDNAHTGQTPRGLVQLLKNLMDHLSPGARLFACPRPDYNYSIIELDQYLRRLVERFIPKSRQGELVDRLATPIKLILFPRIERDSMLTHAVFGHELGHPIATEFLTQEAATTAFLAAQTQIQQSVEKYVQSLPGAAELDPTERLNQVTQLVATALTVRKRALEEIISDSVGILLFGPSALFALHELLWVGDWDQAPQSDSWYPPSRLRVRLVLKLLEDLGWQEALTQLSYDSLAAPYSSSAKVFLDECAAVAAKDDDEEVINRSAILKVAYDSMRASLFDAINFAKHRVGALTFDRVCAGQLPQLLQRLSLGVPPNETGHPFSPSSVDHRLALLAAWLFKLRGLGFDGKSELSPGSTNRLNQTTMRAIEYILLQDDYRNEMAKAAL